MKQQTLIKAITASLLGVCVGASFAQEAVPNNPVLVGGGAGPPGWTKNGPYQQCKFTSPTAQDGGPCGASKCTQIGQACWQCEWEGELPYENCISSAIHEFCYSTTSNGMPFPMGKPDCGRRGEGLCGRAQGQFYCDVDWSQVEVDAARCSRDVCGTWAL